MPQSGQPAVGQFDLFGDGVEVHHVGLVVGDISAFDEKVERVFDPVQKVQVAFVRMHGVLYELIEPSGADSPVQTNLKKGQKLVHMCYLVPNIREAISHAQGRGAMVIAEPVPAVAFGRRLIAWVYHPVFGLFELLEK